MDGHLLTTTGYPYLVEVPKRKVPGTYVSRYLSVILTRER